MNRLVFVFISYLIVIPCLCGQYYFKKLLVDQVWRGKVRQLGLLPDQSIFANSGVFYNDSYIESYVMLKFLGDETKIIKDFFPPTEWLGIFGRSVKFDSNYYYFSSRDNLHLVKDTSDVGWYYSVLNKNGQEILKKKMPMKLNSGFVTDCYGLELVKNNEVIIWGAGLSPSNDPQINDPYIVWVRLKKNGEMISGPHYFKPEGYEKWAIPTDASIDIDSNIVLVYYAKYFMGGKLLLKIYEDDRIEPVFQMPFLDGGRSDPAKFCITKDGHFIITEYKINNPDITVLMKVDNENTVLWQAEIPILMGNEFFGRYSYRNDVSRIIETKNKDIVVCGENLAIDSFYNVSEGRKIVDSGYSSYMARFSASGALKWVHYLIDIDDSGKINQLNIRDVVEDPAGNLIVGGQIGLKNFEGKSNPFIMKIGPNGCFDATCSHVNKWWYIPSEILNYTSSEKSSEQLEVYPNPGTNNINIKLPNDMDESSIISYNLINSQGNMCMSGVLESDYEIDTQFLSNGVYLIVLKDKNGRVFTCKWLKVEP